MQRQYGLAEWRGVQTWHQQMEGMVIEKQMTDHQGELQRKQGMK